MSKSHPKPETRQARLLFDPNQSQECIVSLRLVQIGSNTALAGPGSAGPLLPHPAIFCGSLAGPSQVHVTYAVHFGSLTTMNCGTLKRVAPETTLDIEFAQHWLLAEVVIEKVRAVDG